MVTVPALYDANLMHRREGSPARSFRHRIHLWLVDLDALPALPRLARPLARFDPADHIGRPDRTIRENIGSWLAANGVDIDGGRVLMLANPRVFGYTFNPLTVFWCYRPDGSLRCVVAEVHNTYHERHPYLLFPDEHGVAEVSKEFYVSPFLPADGHYRLRVPAPDERLNVAITLYADDRPVLAASVTGDRRATGAWRALRCSLRLPLLPQRVAALIRRHGIALWLRGAPRNPHPEQANSGAGTY